MIAMGSDIIYIIKLNKKINNEPYEEKAIDILIYKIYLKLLKEIRFDELAKLNY